MSERQNDENKSLISSDIPSSDRENPGYIPLFFISIITVALALLATWYLWGSSYIINLESRLTAVAEAEKGAIHLSDIKNMLERLDDLQHKNEILANKTLKLEQLNIDLQQRVQALEADLHNLRANTTTAENISTKNAWQDHLMNAVKLGLPLGQFRQDKAVPETLREMMSGLDFVPTYKSISKDWSHIRHNLQFQIINETLDSSGSRSWWERFKVFLKKVFRIQRLNADNLTPEETFVRQVDKLMLEKDINALIQWIHQHEKKLDPMARTKVNLWLKKLITFQQGQKIIEMIRTYK